MVINNSKRSFYYNFDSYNQSAQKHEKYKRNVDFPFNCGFNVQEYYKLLNEEVYTNRSKFNLIWRKRMLLNNFITCYTDLLNGIKNNNYEAIESICEESLTTEIAAKMFEHQKFNDIQFRVLNDRTEVSASIINHFYIYGMNIDRQVNESLDQFKMVTKNKNELHYIKKEDIEDLNEYVFKTENQLDYYMDLKQHYQFKEEFEGQERQ